ncbi:ComE operon protein 1 [Oxobacter pfennigii]|uniref:ComE operon protein 1 n=1 Tax=Oxobacter pfennigii TaxID=36849 RepID=A0A0P8YAU3_9CLOT|nr:helix-hairpin-helix domain-containing protein [Oxobacter pfennigii]KPU44148.1 ComE operon protein 1 [Oxobacter pfennigii]
MLKLKKYEEKIIMIAIVILLIIIAVMRIVVFKSDSVRVIKTDSDSEQSIEDGDEKSSGKLYVHITGEVNKPGLYELNTGDRVKDAVNKASGFTDDADTSSINLAGKLKDEQFIYVPKKSAQGESLNQESNTMINGKINVNAATARELDEFLPGIGETYANNIVNYRTKNGRFNSVDELKKVEGIGSGKRFENIKDLVTVN